MQQGCLATPTTCRVIDSQRDLYITDRQLTRGGQWCISCFWPGICVLNSHGPPAGWHKADGSLRAAFLMGQGSVVSFSFSSATVRGWREKEQKGQEKRRSKLDCADVLKCDSCARNSWFLPPPKHPTVGSRETRDRFWHQNYDKQ